MRRDRNLRVDVERRVRIRVVGGGQVRLTGRLLLVAGAAARVTATTNTTFFGAHDAAALRTTTGTGVRLDAIFVRCSMHFFDDFIFHIVERPIL